MLMTYKKKSMIKKLYIPTSTLNFNNIMSSESISPKAFYNNRAFGYARWFLVEENALENAIILYSSFFAFSRPQSDLEDHPMMIEISIDDDELISADNGIYLCNHTIYINPWETKFIFFSEHDKVVTLSLSDSSMETKMLRLYKSRLVVENLAINSPSQSFNVSDIEFNRDAIEFDRNINKYKGLLYGYYIGAYLSTNQSDICRINCLTEIREIVAATLSSSNKQQTSLQSERLHELVNLYNKNNEILFEISQIINDNTKYNLVLKKLMSVGLAIPGIINAENLQNFIQKPIIEGESHPSIRWVDELISKQELINKSHRQLLFTENAEIVCIDGKLDSISTSTCENKQLFYSWVNEILINNKYSKDIISYRKELADTLTYKAKDIIADKWQNCKERDTLNKLRKHLNGEKFDIVWDNNLLCSISSVIIAGDDWNKLFQFMKQKGMTDYRIAFAIYGIIVGFANMVRDFTDLLLNQDSNYLVDVYKEFCGQLLKKQINMQKQVVSQTDISNTNILQNSLSVTSSVEKCIKIEVLEIMHEIKRVSKDAKESLNKALDENGSNTDRVKFMNLLKEFPGWKTKNGPAKIWTDLYSKFVTIDDRLFFDSKNKRDEPSLFGDSLSSFNENMSSTIDKCTMTESLKTKNISVIQDNLAYKHLEECMFLGAYHSSVVELFKNFQKSYLSGFYSKDQQRYKRNNNDVIDHFCKWCLSSKNKKAIPRRLANDRMIEQLKEFLLKIYHD